LPVILATWEAEIGRISVKDQPRQIVGVAPISKITRAKWTGGVAQAVKCKSSEFKSQSYKKKKKKKLLKQTATIFC
jgi:hypothetical protein